MVPTEILSPAVISLGIVDKYLASTHGDSTAVTVEVSQPGFSILGCHTGPPMGPTAVIHLFTWKGTLYANASYPAAAMNSAHAHKTQGKDEDSLPEWVDTFIRILHTAAREETSGS